MELIESIILFPYTVLGFAFKWVISLGAWYLLGYIIYKAIQEWDRLFDFGYSIRSPIKKTSTYKHKQ